MKPFGIISIFLALFSSVIRASQSDDFINLMEEKARIKAEAEANSKPTPGQLIFAPSSVVPKQPTATPTKVVQAAIEEIKTTPNSDRKSRKSKKEEREEEKSDGSDDEETTKEPKKKPTKKDKKISKSEYNDDNDDENELPKRLFRPRFRAENSADALKSFSVSTLLATLSISLLAICFI
jgi:hypothetical protein